jgi:flagellar assembly protein FliH
MSKIIRNSADLAKAWQAPNLKDKSKEANISKEAAPSPELSQQQNVELAKQEGYALGYQQALETHEALFKDKILLVNKVLKKLEFPLAQLDENMQKQIVNLALTVAKKIIAREIKHDTVYVQAMVEEFLQGIQEVKQAVSFSIHPHDAEWLRAALQQHTDGVSAPIHADENLAPGECRLHSDGINLAVTIKARLAFLAAKLMHEQNPNDETP